MRKFEQSDLEPMLRYLNDDLGPLEVAQSLDELEHDYVQLVISDRLSTPTDWHANKVHQIRSLRNVMLKIDGSCKLV